MVKTIGLFIGFFLVMLIVAAVTTGVWQQGILPRLKGDQKLPSPGPGFQANQEPKDPNPPEEKGVKPTGPQEEERRLRELEERLKKERELLSAEGRQLAQLKATIEKLLEQETAKEEARLQHLANLYARMRPKEAAAAIEKMDRAFAARILALIGERQAAKILEALNSTTAADLSHRLSTPKPGAGRES